MANRFKLTTTVLLVACVAMSCTRNEDKTNPPPAAPGEPAPQPKPEPQPEPQPKPEPQPEPQPTEPLVCVPTGVKEPIRSSFAADEITTLCDAAIVKFEASLQAVAAVKPAERTLENTLLKFEKASADFSDETSPLTFVGYTSTNAERRDESSACEQKIGEFSVDIYTRRPLYDALKDLTATEPAQARLLSETLESFEQNGLKADDATLAQVKALKSELSKKETQFSKNLNEDTSFITLTTEELAGAPADMLSRLEKTADGYKVTTKSTDYLDVMQNVTVSESRKKMQIAYMNRGGPANTKLLEEAVVLRQQIAKLLGYKTWADYRTVTRMAKDGKTALDFLNNLKEKLSVRNQQDFDQLLAFKKTIEPNATELNQWDIAFYSNKLQKKAYQVDNEVVREYFPAETVTAGTFEVYSKLLGVQYVEVKDRVVWNSDVRLYEIHDPKDCALLGYFYADLVPRAGKYGHAAAFTLRSGRSVDGKYNLPVASIVANFTPPANGKPSLLLHDEVETFFHEFGHIMHQTLTRAPYASLSGANVSQDFVEAPSQMLENWVWDAGILSRISGHYETKAKLPADLLEKMIAARNFQQGASYTKQLLYSLFDLTIHTAEGPVDVTKTYDDLYRDIVKQEPLPGNHFAGTFGHMMGGYDAGYYGYLWSQVYSTDMFTLFPADDLTSAAVGGKYRKVVLEQGNMKDSIDILREFLGREPNADAFLKKLGL